MLFEDLGHKVAGKVFQAAAERIGEPADLLGEIGNSPVGSLLGLGQLREFLGRLPLRLS